MNPGSVGASFVVDAPGSYSISLTVSNGSAADKTMITVSTVNSPPVANAGPNQAAPLLATVILNGSGSSDVDGDPLTYLWSLVSRPSGSTAELSNLRSVRSSFVADAPGTFVAQLIVNDGIADSVPATVTVAVAGANTPPVANAGPNQSANVGAVVQLNGSGSTDVDGDPLTYRWSLITLPAGSNAALSNPRAVNPTFTADVAGIYVAQLIVNDGTVDSPPSTVSITTNTTLAPTANAGPNQTVAHGTLVTLNGSGADPQQLPLTFTWSLIARPAGSAAPLSSIHSPNATFVADQPGTYVAQLVVSNGSLTSNPATVTITTTNTPPVADAGANRAVATGVVVVLDGSNSSDADHDPITWSWSLISRPAGSTAVLQGAGTVSPSFFADVAGTYVAQLIVSDGFTTSNPSTVTITAGTAGISLSPNPLNISNSSAVLVITLASPAPAGGISLTVTSSNPGVASVPGSVFLTETSSSVGLRVVGAAPGSAVIQVSAPGFGQASVNVTVQAPGSITLSGPAAIGLSQTAALTVALSTPAPAEGVTIQLASSDTSIVSLPLASVFVPPGATAPVSAPQVFAGNVGSAAIIASASGYGAPPPLTVRVTATVTWVTQNATITGIGNQTFVTLRLLSIAPGAPGGPLPTWANGLVVNLSSSNPNVATIQPTGIFIWDGSVAPGIAIPVTAVGVGTTVIHASGVNIPDVTMTVTVQ
jgi:hypothetical protein